MWRLTTRRPDGFLRDTVRYIGWIWVTLSILSLTEETNLGTDPNNEDTDVDGSRDGAEVIAGTNPLDASSFFTLESATRNENTGNVILTWPSLPGREYVVRASDDLVAKLLLAYPEGVNKVSMRGYTPLDCALRRKDNIRGKIMEAFVTKSTHKNTKAAFAKIAKEVSPPPVEDDSEVAEEEELVASIMEASE